MFAGLPGTGVGGIFYLMLSIWMPFNELIRMFRGEKTSLERWAFIGRHWALFSAVIAMIWGQTALMRWLIPASDQAAMKAGGRQVPMSDVLGTQTGSMMLSSAVMALTGLVVIVALVHLARVGMRVRAFVRA